MRSNVGMNPSPIDWERYPNEHFLMFQTTFYALFDVSSLNYLILFIFLEISIGL